MFAGPKAAVCRLAAIAVSSALCAMLAGPLSAAAYPAPASVAAAGGGCGSVEIGSSNTKDVLADENCFSKAWSTCDAAMFAEQLAAPRDRRLYVLDGDTNYFDVHEILLHGRERGRRARKD